MRHATAASGHASFPLPAAWRGHRWAGLGLALLINLAILSVFVGVGRRHRPPRAQPLHETEIYLQSPLAQSSARLLPVPRAAGERKLVAATPAIAHAPSPVRATLPAPTSPEPAARPLAATSRPSAPANIAQTGTATVAAAKTAAASATHEQANSATVAVSASSAGAAQADPFSIASTPNVAKAISAQKTSRNIDAGTIRIAVRDAIDANRALEARHAQVDTPLTTKQDKLDKEFDFAVVPDCIRPDGLKHDPPIIKVPGLPMPIALPGVLALPFLAHAALTGKCR